MAQIHSIPAAGSLQSAYPEFQALLNAIEHRPLLAQLGMYRHGRGRAGYPLQALWCSHVATFYFNMPHTNALMRRLEDDAPLRAICGFGDTIPHRTTFNRFVNRLKRHTALVESAIARVTTQIHKKHLADLGKIVAVDSTFVKTHANPQRKNRKGKLIPSSDPDAKLGAKEKKGSEAMSRKKDPSYRYTIGKTDYHFGYKKHMIADAIHGVPLAEFVTPANRNDSPTLPTLVEKAESLLPWFNPAVLLADKGYDSEFNNDFIADRGVIPIIAIREMPKRKKRRRKGEPNSPDTLRDGIYTDDGIPTCMGMVAMEYVRSESAPVIQHLYRCREGGCHLKDSTVGGIRHCDTEIWEDPTVNVRRFGSGVRRGSATWTHLYRKRQSIERIFKSMKESRRLEAHSLRGLAHISLHSLMSTLVFQATVLVRLEAGDKQWMRWMVKKVA